MVYVGQSEGAGGGEATLVAVAAENTGSPRGSYAETDKVWNCIGQAQYIWTVNSAEQTITLVQDADQGDDVKFVDCYPDNTNLTATLPCLGDSEIMIGKYETGMEYFVLEDTGKCTRLEMRMQTENVQEKTQSPTSLSPTLSPYAAVASLTCTPTSHLVHMQARHRFRR